MDHPYKRFLIALMEAVNRRLAGMAGPYSPSANVLVFVSFFPALNLYALFTHLLFPDWRHCSACKTDVRVMYGFLAWVFLVLFHKLLLLTESPVQPLPPPALKSWWKYYKVYALFSIITALL